MIEVIDRVPTKPGRVKLIPVPGMENVYDMVRFDEPTTPGTPINKALFDSIGADISLLHQNVANIINEHASLAEIGSLPAGAEFGIYENGILVPYIKVSGDYGGTGRSAVIRKHLYKMDFLSNNTQRTKYANSYTDAWLNNEFLSPLDSRVRDAIEPVPVPCTIGNGSNASETIERKVFIPSLAEMGAAGASGYMTEGTAFPYFNSSERRIALFNGKAEYYWTRSPNVSYSGYMGGVTSVGNIAMNSPWETQWGIRPVFTLPHNFEVNMGGVNTGNTMAAAEVI